MTQPDHEEKTYRYHARELSDGFVIEGGEDRQSITVRLRSSLWEVEPVEQAPQVPPPDYRFGLFDAYRLIDVVTELSLMPWRPRTADQPSVPEWKMKKWALAQARRPIAWIIGQQRQRLLALHPDPRIVEMQKAVFAASFYVGDLAKRPEFVLHADPHLLSDIQKYRAAAIAVNVFGDDILNRHAWKKDYGVQLACRRLLNWRQLYSNTGKSYPALNRTLDSFPGAIPSSLAGNIRSDHLTRSYHDRLELLVLLGSRECGIAHQRVFETTTRTEILQAMTRVSDAMQVQMSPRRTDDVQRFVRFLKDYPDPCYGGIGNLATRSIRYHRDLAAGRIVRPDNPYHPVLNLPPDETAVPLPPFPLPDIPGLRFLDTVGAIRREGAVMRHCIASYVQAAVQGTSYLFHYEFGEETASVEVSPDGTVRQSYGPANTLNKAATRARSLMGRWKRTRPVAQVTPENASDDFPF